METLGAIDAQLREHDRRLTANHDSVRDLRVQGADHETRIAVIQTELLETRKDLEAIQNELSWVKRGMWAAAGSFLLFFVAAASLLINVSGH